jgi:hypothetical protein
MSFIQNVQPPKNQRLEFNLEDFTGGLNNRSSVIRNNEASYVLNMHFTHQNVLEKRKGFKLVDDLTLPEAVTYVDLYKPYNSDDQLIRASNTEVYAEGFKVQDVLGEIDAVNFQGMYFFADGDSLYVYGSFLETTGTYLEIIGTIPDTYVTLKVVNPPGDFEPLPEEHTRGKMVYDYDNMTVHYEPCLNELEDSYLGANLLPEHPKFIESHKGRLFISGDNKDDDNVFITHTSNPFYFAVGLPIQLPPSSDKVRGMVIYDDAVIIGRERDIYRIIGETSNPNLGFALFELRKINTHTGVANNKCFDVAHNYLFFLGSDGVAYALSTTRMDERLVGTQIISEQLDLFKDPINGTTENILDASTVFDTEYWFVTIGDKTLVYSYRHRAWTMFDYIDMYAPFYYYDKLIWGRRDGSLAEFSEDYLDNGRPIYATWSSNNFDFGSATRYKQFREFFLVAHAYDDNDSDIRVTFEIDYSDVRNATTVENKISYWGIAKFGDRFINRNINASVPFVIGRRARYMRIKISNGYEFNTVVPTEIDLLDISRKYNYMGAIVEETGVHYYYEDGTWTPLSTDEINQPMRVYKVNGDYEMKGKR